MCIVCPYGINIIYSMYLMYVCICLCACVLVSSVQPSKVIRMGERGLKERATLVHRLQINHIIHNRVFF